MTSPPGSVAVSARPPGRGPPCGACRAPIRVTALRCPTCRVELHRDCRALLRRCPTLGCATPLVGFEQVRGGSNRLAQARARRSPSEVRALTWVVAVTGALLLAAAVRYQITTAYRDPPRARLTWTRAEALADALNRGLLALWAPAHERPDLLGLARHGASAVPPLLEWFEDDLPARVRARVLRTLSILVRAGEPLPARAVARALELYPSDPAYVAELIRALDGCGSPTLSVLTRALRCGPPDRRLAALALLHQLDGRSPTRNDEVVAALIACADGRRKSAPAPAVRARALLALWELRDRGRQLGFPPSHGAPSAVLELIVAEPDPRARAVGTIVDMAWHGHPSPVPRSVLAALGPLAAGPSRDPAWRDVVDEALRLLAGLTDLEPFLEDGLAPVRAGALHALSLRFNRPAFTSSTIERLAREDPDPSVRAAAAVLASRHADRADDTFGVSGEPARLRCGWTLRACKVQRGPAAPPTERASTPDATRPAR